MTKYLRGSIHGKVAAILSSREVAINLGYADGVSKGMKFAILNPRGFDIRDPDTMKPLGSIYRPKIRVEVVHAEEHVCLAQTYETYRSGSWLGLGSVASLFAPLQTRPVTLKKSSFSSEEIDEEESIVKVGDPVEQIIEVPEVDASPAPQLTDDPDSGRSTDTTDRDS